MIGAITADKTASGPKKKSEKCANPNAKSLINVPRHDELLLADDVDGLVAVCVCVEEADRARPRTQRTVSDICTQAKLDTHVHCVTDRKPDM